MSSNYTYRLLLRIRVFVNDCHIDVSVMDIDASYGGVENKKRKR